MSLTTYTFDNESYYLSNDIKERDGSYFYGCSKSLRLLIGKKNISSDNYVFANYSKRSGWTMSDKENPPNKAKLFFKKIWAENNVPKMKVNMEEEEDETYIHQAPPIIELRDEEKFRDNNGVVLDIETRGSRDVKNAYFKASDIGKAFGIIKITDTLKHDSFIKGDDYVSFICQEADSSRLLPIKYIFMTYEGVLSLLFKSRASGAKHFLKWATETLFIHQMGTLEQKTGLAKTLIKGLTLEQGKLAIDTAGGCQDVSGIYCIVTTTAGEFRKMDTIKCTIPQSISDDSFIVKFGMSDRMADRMNDHRYTTFKSMNFTPVISDFAIVEKGSAKEAEQTLSGYLTAIGSKVVIDGHDEFVAIEKKQLKDVKTFINMIRNNYEGRANVANSIIANMKRDFEAELKDKDHIIELKDREIELKDEIIKSKDKDILIAQLQLRV